MRRLGSNDPCGLVSCTSYGDVDEVSEALAPAGVEPVVRVLQGVPQAGAHILSRGRRRASDETESGRLLVWKSAGQSQNVDDTPHPTSSYQ